MSLSSTRVHNYNFKMENTNEHLEPAKLTPIPPESEVKPKEVYKAIKIAEEHITGLSSKVAIVLGPSGVGKSTSILTFHGDDMVAYTGQAGNTILVNKGHKRHTQEEILSGRINKVIVSDQVIAGTANPIYLSLKGSENECYLWDMPGFGDNRGLTQILINTYYINRLFDLHKKVTLFFTISADYFREDERAKTLIETLKNFLQMLGDSRKYKKSIALLVTKSNKLFTQDSVRSSLEQILKLIPAVKNNDSLSELFRAIINKQIPIILVPVPQIPTDVHTHKDHAIDVTSQYERSIQRTQNVMMSLATTSFNEIQMPMMRKEDLQECICFADDTAKDISVFTSQFFQDLDQYIRTKYALESFDKNKNYSQIFAPITLMKQFVDKMIKIAENAKSLVSKENLLEKFSELKNLCENKRYNFTKQANQILMQIKNAFIMVDFLVILRFGQIDANKFKWINVENVMREFFSKIALKKGSIQKQIDENNNSLNGRVESFTQSLIDKYLNKVTSSQFFKIWQKNASTFPSFMMKISNFNKFKDAKQFVNNIEKDNQYINVDLEEITVMKHLYENFQKQLKMLPSKQFFEDKILKKIRDKCKDKTTEITNYQNWKEDTVNKNLGYINIGAQRNLQEQMKIYNDQSSKQNEDLKKKCKEFQSKLQGDNSEKILLKSKIEELDVKVRNERQNYFLKDKENVEIRAILKTMQENTENEGRERDRLALQIIELKQQVQDLKNQATKVPVPPPNDCMVM